MKDNRGITLTSLIIYIIALMIFVGTMATITKYFYKNFKEITINDKETKEYTELTKFLSQDINSKKIENTFINDRDNQETPTGHELIFKLNDLSTHRYKLKDNTIYYTEIQNNTATKDITLCNEVNSCTFSLGENQNTITVSIEFEGGTHYTTAYTIQK